MATARECKQLERELERAREEYVRENEPCGNTGCGFYREGSSGHCAWYHYWADDCKDYRA